MSHQFFSKRRLQRLRNSSFLAAGACGLIAGAAFAQNDGPSAPLKFRSNYFGYAASVSPRVTYTDNINLRPDGFRDGELITSTLFNASAIFSNSRVTGILDGDIDFSYLTDQGEFVVNQRIGAASTTTIADNLLYFDLAGSSSRQLVGDNARFSANINAARGQRANVHSISASPYINRRFADDSSAELRYRFSYVLIDDSSLDGNTFNNLLNDSQTQEVSASYHSGKLFERMKFSLLAYGNRTDEDGSDIVPAFTYEQGSVSGEGQYAITDRFALSGAVGYDDVQIDGLMGVIPTQDLSGVFWRGGFVAKPGRRTHIRLEYGRRYDDDFIDGEIRYQMSERFLFTAGAERSFQTRAQNISTQFRANQRRTLDFADRLREGEALSAREIVEAASRVNDFNTINAQSIGLGVTNSAYAQLSGAFDRTTVAATASYQDTDFGFRQYKGFNFGLNGQRQISRRMGAYGDLFYRRSDTTVDPAVCIATPIVFGIDPLDPITNPVTACNNFAAINGITNTVGGRVGLTYRILKNVSAFGELSHTKRFSDIAVLEYGENAVSAGLTLDF